MTLGEVMIAIIIAAVLLISGYMFWSEGEKRDLETCKLRYGKEYILGHSSSNSSIKWCQAPNGEMKSL